LSFFVNVPEGEELYAPGRQVKKGIARGRSHSLIYVREETGRKRTSARGPRRSKKKRKPPGNRIKAAPVCSTLFVEWSQSSIKILMDMRTSGSRKGEKKTRLLKDLPDRQPSGGGD